MEGVAVERLEREGRARKSSGVLSLKVRGGTCKRYVKESMFRSSILCFTPDQARAAAPVASPPPVAQVEPPTPESKWDEIGATSLKKALQNTIMIDAAWLADLADKDGVVPRCQDVPEEAKVSLSEMEAWAKDSYTVGALIIS